MSRLPGNYRFRIGKVCEVRASALPIRPAFLVVRNVLAHWHVRRVAGCRDVRGPAVNHSLAAPPVSSPGAPPLT